MSNIIASVVVLVAAFVGFGAALVGILAVFGVAAEIIALALIGYMIVVIAFCMIKCLGSAFID